MGGAAFGGHALAQHLGRFAAALSQLRRPGKGADGQFGGGLRRQAQYGAGAAHGFQKIKHVGRARAGQRGHGV